MGAYAVASSVALFLFAPFADVFLGADFSESTDVIRWMIGIPLIHLLGLVLAESLTGADLQGTRNSFVIGAAALNVVLNLALIGPYGWGGAVIATYVSEIFLLFGVILLDPPAPLGANGGQSGSRGTVRVSRFTSAVRPMERDPNCSLISSIVPSRFDGRLCSVRKSNAKLHCVGVAEVCDGNAHLCQSALLGFGPGCVHELLRRLENGRGVVGGLQQSPGSRGLHEVPETGASAPQCEPLGRPFGGGW